MNDALIDAASCNKQHDDVLEQVRYILNDFAHVILRHLDHG